jgi:hypothetical protein
MSAPLSYHVVDYRSLQHRAVKACLAPLGYLAVDHVRLVQQRGMAQYLPMVSHGAQLDLSMRARSEATYLGLEEANRTRFQPQMKSDRALDLHAGG